MHGRSRSPVQRLRGAVLPPTLCDFGAAAIHPRHQRPDRFTSCVHGHDAVHRTRQSYGADVATAICDFEQCLVQGLRGGAFDVARIQFDEIGTRCVKGVPS